ncbi:hypothetical protein BCR43DRAFT_499139 [Syncephalastrum racemosum]|uniref:UspA domain-containing protein n=1 Tax=Syncephalastrum racemosum TaxID=13706 RepID=A0A1X2GZT9_SYNRA|nr:hypothetical protein BCR43DRAFT_499139 [Syncephalastrum racemosum]
MVRSIAIAVDPESSDSFRTLEWAKENFLRSTDHIHLISILVLDTEFMDGDAMESFVTPEQFADLEHQLTTGRMEAMRKLAEALEDYNTTIQVFQSSPNRAGNVLIQYVDTAHMECLIMGSRNLSGWRRFISGSFSEYVQTHVHCPVLIVKK